MLRQFHEISSWRKHDVTIEPHEVFTLNFRDTLPNIFVVNNPNLAVLKISISTIPRTDAYEFKVEYNTTETVGRPIGTNNLYILNDSSVPVKIVVFSIEKDFEPSLLKNMNVSLDGYTIESSSVISGVHDGVVLPVKLSEDNRVSVEEMNDLMLQTYPDIIAKLQTLIDKKIVLDGTNMTLNGVQTDLTTVHSNMSSIITKLDSLFKPSDLSDVSVEVANLTDSLNVVQENVAKLSRFYTPKNKGTYLNNVTSFEYTATNKECLHFGWFMNDGEDCNIIVNGETVFSIWSGEQFSDFEIELNPNDIVRVVSDAGNYRIKYWIY